MPVDFRPFILQNKQQKRLEVVIELAFRKQNM